MDGPLSDAWWCKNTRQPLIIWRFLEWLRSLSGKFIRRTCRHRHHHHYHKRRWYW